MTGLNKQEPLILFLGDVVIFAITTAAFWPTSKTARCSRSKATAAIPLIGAPYAVVEM